MRQSIQLSPSKRQLLAQMQRGTMVGHDDQAQVTPRAADCLVPASAEQRHIWLHAATAPERPLYNESITVHRYGDFDLATMNAAWQEFLRRHEIWRTSFTEQDGELRQMVHERIDEPLRLIDVSDRPAEARAAAALRIAQAAARVPLDLGQAPLFRAVIVRLAPDHHLLCLTLHHIIFDGVGIYHVLMSELPVIYAAIAAGGRSPLAQPQLQYADYAAWQSHRTAAALVAGQLDYWRDVLQDAPPPVALPSDRPLAPLARSAGAMEVFRLDPALVDCLKQISVAHGVTLYMTLLAAFIALLHLYSGETDILIGGVTDTRSRPELQPLMGYFLNLIALRTRPTPELTFTAFLSQVRDVVLGAVAAREVPFEQVVRALQPRREAGGSHPFFQVLFSMEPPAPAFPDGWDLTQMDVVVDTAKFDLYLELDDRPEGFVARFLYSADLFDAATIRRMTGHYTVLLRSLAASPTTTLGDLTMLGTNERDELALASTGPRRDVPSDGIAALFEAQMRRTPLASAVVFEGVSWSYHQLNAAAERLAQDLQDAGLAEGALVGLQASRSHWMLAGLLGILKAGGHYLPLDPGLPPERLKWILLDADPALLLTDGPAGAAPLRVVRRRRSAGWPLSACDEPVHDKLAYLIYTSGSTGRPKGVEVTLRNLVNLLVSMQATLAFRPADRLLAVTTLSFDIAGLELWLPLIAGGTVILASQEVAADPHMLARAIARERPSVMQATPTIWRALVDAGWPGDTCLKILCGGEALPRPLADDLLTRGATLWNLYGPTETTIWSLLHKVTAGNDKVPIGRPIDNTRIEVRDRQGHAVPIGVAGELCIGGSGVARGYRNSPALTADRFLSTPAGLLYRTGDLVRQRPDHTIDWLGRLDNAIKIRGVRVIPEEVEAVMQGHPDVVAAAVRPRIGSAGGGIGDLGTGSSGMGDSGMGTIGLTGYVVLRDNTLLDEAGLQMFLRRHLPNAMIPAPIMAMPALPLTSNGKIDRQALPEASLRPAAPVLPRNEIERRLCLIWSDLLKVGNVGMEDDFFDLGGHSLLATKLIHRVEAEFGRRLKLAHVFQAPTIALMAALLGAAARAPVLSVFPMQPADDGHPLFWFQGGANFRALARALGAGKRFLGVVPDLEEQPDLIANMTIERVAASFVRTIRAEQPAGPYYIGGWCNAGIVAYEATRQLEAAGETVGLLMMIDAVNPVYWKQLGRAAIELSRGKYHLRHMARLKPTARLTYAFEQVRDGLKRAMRGRHGLNTELDVFGAALETAAYRYRPGPCRSDAVLFQPKDRPDLLDFHPGWAGLIKGSFMTYNVTGTHTAMLDSSNVGEWAGLLQEHLSAAGFATVLPLERVAP